MEAWEVCIYFHKKIQDLYLEMIFAAACAWVIDITQVLILKENKILKEVVCMVCINLKHASRPFLPYTHEEFDLQNGLSAIFEKF